MVRGQFSGGQLSSGTIIQEELSGEHFSLGATVLEPIRFINFDSTRKHLYAKNQTIISVNLIMI